MLWSGLVSIAAEQFYQLVELLRLVFRVARFDRVRDAVRRVAFENLFFHAFQRRLDRLHLIQNVDAVAIVLDHPTNSADLTLYPGDPSDQFFIGHLVYSVGVYIKSCAVAVQGSRKMTRRDVKVVSVTALVLGALLVLFAFAVISLGLFNVAADAPHTAVVAQLIGLTRERSIERRAEEVKVPPLNDPAMIREGAEHYDAMCVSCHLAPGMQENEMRPGMNPKPPVLASIPPESPAEQFWIIKHGLKMTAMPAWGTTHSDEEIWNMVALLQKLSRLSPSQYRALVAQAGHHHDQMEMSN